VPHRICNLIVIGASTGGTRILPRIISQLPRLQAAVLVIQHMPEYITPSFVRTLAQQAHMPVHIAAARGRLAQGQIFVAPGGWHCELQKNAEFSLNDGPRVNYVRPSIDVTMRSVALTPKARKLCGVILTGMGSDGAAGLLHLKRLGAFTFAQNENSSAVFSMPKMAIATGCVDHVLDPDAIADQLARLFV